MRTWGAAAGLLAGAVALGVAELTAAVTGPSGAPVVAVGEAAINLTPVPVKEFAIAHFGTHDKQALIAGILVLLAGLAAVTGVLTVRRLRFGLAGLAALAAVGAAAGISLPGAGVADVLPTLAGVAAGAGTLILVVHAVRGLREGPGAEGPGRRQVLIAGTTAAGSGPGSPRPASTPGSSGCGAGTPPRACTSCGCGPPTTPARRRHRGVPIPSPAARAAGTPSW